MRIVPSEQAQALGHCLYTTYRIHEHQPLYWEEHQRRLSQSMRDLHFDLEVNWPLLRDFATHHGPHQGLCRITVTTSEVLVSYRGFKPIPEEVTVLVSNQQVHPTLGVHKTGNHLPYTRAAQEVLQAGAFEGLLWDASKQFVVDGTRAGFFLQLQGDLIEPLGGLPSVTRQKAFERLEQVPLQRWVTLQDLLEAEHLWLCGSGMGVLPVDCLKVQQDGQKTGELRRFATTPLELMETGLIPPR